MIFDSVNKVFEAIALGFKVMGNYVLRFGVPAEDAKEDPRDLAESPGEPSEESPAECLTVRAYSEKYGVPKSTVRSWIKKGKLETAEKVLGRTMVKDNKGTPRKVNGKWIFEGKDAGDEQAVSDDQAV